MLSTVQYVVLTSSSDFTLWSISLSVRYPPALAGPLIFDSHTMIDGEVVCNGDNDENGNWAMIVVDEMRHIMSWFGVVTEMEFDDLMIWWMFDD
jgi:hypothetical protein